MDPNTTNQPVTQPAQETPMPTTPMGAPEQPMEHASGKKFALMGTLVTIVAIIVVAGGAWYMLSMKSAEQPTTTTSITPPVSTPTAGASATITPEVSSDSIPSVGTSEEINTDFTEVNTNVSQL